MHCKFPGIITNNKIKNNRCPIVNNKQSQALKIPKTLANDILV